MPVRFDIHDLPAAEVTPEGYLRQREVVLSRVGVFEYRRADGTIRRELRPPDEVGSSASVESFANQPVTLGHPEEPVSADNAERLAVGAVGDVVRLDGDVLIASSLTIHRKDAVNAAQSGGFRQLSNGYRVDLDETPGVWKGERYDAIQRNIRGNHVALVKRGRAGEVASLRLDGADAVSVPTNHDRGDAPKGVTKMAKVTIDGATYEVSEGLAPVITGMSARLDELASNNKALVEERDKALVERDLAKTEADKARNDAATAEDFEERVAQRVALIAKVKDVAPNFKCDGLDDEAIHRGVVAQLEPELKLDGKSADVAAFAFEQVAERFAKGKSKTRKLREDASAARGNTKKVVDLAEVNRRNLERYTGSARTDQKEG